MISELEQEFFKKFKIEPKKLFSARMGINPDAVFYPEITAEKLLQLLCIVINEYNRNGRTLYLDSTNVKELKEDILDALMGCIDASCDLFEPEVKQIQQLFKDEQ